MPLKEANETLHGYLKLSRIQPYNSINLRPRIEGFFKKRTGSIYTKCQPFFEQKFEHSQAPVRVNFCETKQLVFDSVCLQKIVVAADFFYNIELNLSNVTNLRSFSLCLASIF